MKEFLTSVTSGCINHDVSICVHSYADAKKSTKMKEQLEVYNERWKSLGFTEGFPEERKEELAYSFEQLAVFLTFCKEDQTDRLFEKDEHGYCLFETLGFPMIRKVLGNLEPNEFDFQKFLKYCKIFNVNDVYNEVNWEGRPYTIDTEAKCCAIACDMIEEKFKNPDKDDNVIKEKWMNDLHKNNK